MSNFVTYKARNSQTMRARVIRRHRDGSVTVEPYFWLDANGKDNGVFQGGFTLRLPVEDVQSLSDA